MTVREFINISNIITPDSLERISEVHKPDTICGKKTPDTINDISFGKLVALQEIRDTKDMLFVPAKILLDLTEDDVIKEDFESVIGFANWIAKEVERIGKLFERTSVKPTSDEVMAGIDRMSFGVFGIIDYYAQRMGLSNHDEVESIPWIRIYKCLSIDAERVRFNRRLRKVLEKKKR